MTKMQESLLYLVFFSFWLIRLYYKLYDKETRKYILYIGILIVFWLVLRICKSIINISIIKRLLWYLYYIPMLLIPSLFYIFSNISIGKKICKKSIYIVSIILIIFVLTNDIHNLAFKFPNGLEDYTTYKHNIVYFIICIWSFFLVAKGMINLAIDKIKIKKDFKAFLPLIVLIIEIIYTGLYICNFKSIRTSNLTVITSIIVCVAIELMFYLNLIPNNSNYKKIFENSSIDMAIISLDGKTTYLTKTFRNIPNRIINDIKNNTVKDNYKKGSLIYEVKKNKDSYVISKEDITKLNELKKEIDIKQNELLKQQKSLKNEKKIIKELYEIKLRKKIILKLEDNLKNRKEEAQKILNKEKITKEDLEKVKLLVAYCKRKSSLIISEFNNEIYNDVSIKILIQELLADFNSFGINGAIVVSKMNINSYIMSSIYEIIFSVLELLKNIDIFIIITKNINNIEIKLSVGKIINFKNKLNLDNNIIINEKHYENDTNISFIIGKVSL